MNMESRAVVPPFRTERAEERSSLSRGESEVGWPPRCNGTRKDRSSWAGCSDVYGVTRKGTLLLSVPLGVFT